MKASARSLESSVVLPGVSERRPLALPIETPPKAEELVFVYSPLRGEWTIGVWAMVRPRYGRRSAAANALDATTRPGEG